MNAVPLPLPAAATTVVSGRPASRAMRRSQAALPGVLEAIAAASATAATGTALSPLPEPVQHQVGERGADLQRPGGPTGIVPARDPVDRAQDGEGGQLGVAAREGARVHAF